MTGDVFDGRPARTTATLAAIVATAVVTLVGRATGFGRLTVIAILGSALLAAGAWGIEQSARTRQAGGSVAATAGAALLFGLSVLAAVGRGGWVLFALSLGHAFIAVDAAVGFEWARIRKLSSVLLENGKAVLAGILLSPVLYLILAYDVVGSLFGSILAVSTITPLAGFVTLQLFALCVALAVPRAVSVLKSWVSDDNSNEDAVSNSVEFAGIRTEDVPRVYWFALAAQFVAVFVPQANELFALFFGGVLGPVLTSGVLHGLLGLILLALLAIFVAAVVRRAVIVWFGAVPAQTLALQAGGITSILVAVLVGVIAEYLPDDRVVDLIAPLAVDRPGLVGLSASALAIGGAAVLVAVLVVVLLLEVGPSVARLGFAPDRATGFALGSGMLFVATLGAATGRTPAVVVFVGVAGALLTWDLGSHASSVGTQLGQAADTRRSEFVHVTGSTLVLGGAIAVATLAHYLVVPATAPTGTQRTSGLAALSMILVLVALLSFVAAVHLRGRADGA